MINFITEPFKTMRDETIFKEYITFQAFRKEVNPQGFIRNAKGKEVIEKMSLNDILKGTCISEDFFLEFRMKTVVKKGSGN